VNRGQRKQLAEEGTEETEEGREGDAGEDTAAKEVIGSTRRSRRIIPGGFFVLPWSERLAAAAFELDPRVESADRIRSVPLGAEWFAP
jgi:hypothetical protein